MNCQGASESRIIDHSTGRLLYALILLLAAIICPAGVSATPPERVVSFNISELNAAEALTAFAEQAGVTLVFPYEETTAVTANPLTGSYRLIDGLTALLAGTPLSVSLNDGQFTIQSANKREHRSLLQRLFGTGQNDKEKSVETVTSDSWQHVIEEVVVTAQRREQSVQDVSISVTSFSADDKRFLRVVRPEDIAAQTPGLDIKNALGSVNPVFTLRGIGLNDYNINNNPSVGVYVDEIYMASSAYLSFQTFDLERIEVLKGPQGTLYGRNTTGGTVNFISARPTAEVSGYLDVDYSRWNTVKVEGAFSGPLGDRLQGRLAFQTLTSDGYYKNNGTTSATGTVGARASVLDDEGIALGLPAAAEVTPPIPFIASDNDFFEQDMFALRGKLQWQPGENIRVAASAHYSRDVSDMLVRSMDPASVDINGFSPADDDPYTIDANFGAGSESVDIEGTGGLIKIEVAFDAGNFVSLTGYESIRRTLPFEDTSPFRILDQLFVDKLSGWSQEFRLESHETDRYYWQVGAYASVENVDSFKQVNGADGLYRTSIATEFKQRGKNQAIFAHGEWQLNKSVRLTLGARYSKGNKRYKGGSFVPLAPYGPHGVDLTTLYFNIPQFGDDSFSESDSTGKLAVQWHPNDNLMYYLSWKKGFKSGGYDGSTILETEAFTPFLGESVYAWEAGFKKVSVTGRLRWHVSTFSYEYRDMQAEALRDFGNLSFETVRSNVGEGEITGIESDLRIKPLPGLDMRFGLSYVDTEITKWNTGGHHSPDPVLVANSLAGIQTHLGNQLPDSPRLTLNIMISYQWLLNSSLRVRMMLDSSYTDDVFKDIANQVSLKADSYWLTNARIILTPLAGRWELSLWGKNLEDKLYHRQRADNFGPTWVYETPGMPRSYGVSMRYSW